MHTLKCVIIGQLCHPRESIPIGFDGIHMQVCL